MDNVQKGVEMYDVLNQSHAIESPGVTYTLVGIDFNDAAIPYEKWEAMVTEMLATESAFRWWLGDLLNYGEKTYGEKYAQAIDMTGLSIETLTDYAYVARHVPISLRTDILSWSHHKQVARFEYLDQRSWLRRAALNGWSVSEFRRQIKLADAIEAPGATETKDSMNLSSPPNFELSSPPEPLVTHEYWAESGDDYDSYVERLIDLDSPRHWDAANEVMPDLTAYFNLSGLQGYSPYGQTFVDVKEDDQETAFLLLREALHRGDVSEFIFVADGAPHDLIDQWHAATPRGERIAACLTGDGTVFYVGCNVDDFADAFRDLGVVVLPYARDREVTY